MSKRILIVLFGAIGDVTQALPVAVRLKKFWPDCRISWVVEPPSKNLLEGHPSVDRVVVFDRPKGFSAYIRCIQEIRQESYDLVLDLQRHVKSGFTSWLSRGEKRWGFHRRNAKEFNWVFNNSHITQEDRWLPKIQHYQRFLDQLGLPEVKPLEYRLEPTEAECARVRNLIETKLAEKQLSASRGFAALVIGASWQSKLWPLDNYAELISRLYQDEGLISIVVGGRTEKEAGEQLTRAAQVPAISFVAETNLRELCALFQETAIVIGSDSGPAHIAAACGKRVITLWGSTSARRSSPYGSEDLALQSAIGCSPCYRRSCPGLGTICMKDIPAEAVLLRLKQLVRSDQKAFG